MTIELSPLPKTWIFDIDGTLVIHNGYKNGKDKLLSGVKEFYARISETDCIILLTARVKDEIPALKSFLKKNGLRYNHIISGIPIGERILVNDTKPSGLLTAYAVNKIRDEKLEIDFKINKNL
jgi:hypothetical protein